MQVPGVSLLGGHGAGALEVWVSVGVPGVPLSDSGFGWSCVSQSQFQLGLPCPQLCVPHAPLWRSVGGG